MLVAPTVVPRKMVTMFISAFCAVSESLSTSPHSRNRLPSMKQPISGATSGSSRTQKMVTATGRAWAMCLRHRRQFRQSSSFY